MEPNRKVPASDKHLGTTRQRTETARVERNFLMLTNPLL
jgi:hypothetical protein